MGRGGGHAAGVWAVTGTGKSTQAAAQPWGHSDLSLAAFVKGGDIQTLQSQPKQYRLRAWNTHRAGSSWRVGDIGKGLPRTVAEWGRHDIEGRRWNIPESKKIRVSSRSCLPTLPLHTQLLAPTCLPFPPEQLACELLEGRNTANIQHMMDE